MGKHARVFVFLHISICLSVDVSVTEQPLQGERRERVHRLHAALQPTVNPRVKDSHSIYSPDKSQKYQYCITLHKILLYALMDNIYLLIQISYCESLFTI